MPNAQPPRRTNEFSLLRRLGRHRPPLCLVDFPPQVHCRVGLEVLDAALHVAHVHVLRAGVRVAAGGRDGAFAGEGVGALADLELRLGCLVGTAYEAVQFRLTGVEGRALVAVELDSGPGAPMRPPNDRYDLAEAPRPDVVDALADREASTPDDGLRFGGLIDRAHELVQPGFADVGGWGRDAAELNGGNRFPGCLFSGGEHFTGAAHPDVVDLIADLELRLGILSAQAFAVLAVGVVLG